MDRQTQNEVKRIDLHIGDLYEECNRLRERIASMSGATSQNYLTPTASGTIVAGDGLSGGGTLPGTVTIHVGAGDGIDVAANDVAVDVTDFIDTSYGLTEDTNNIRVNLASPSGLAFNAGALEVADAIAGDGLTISSKELAVNTGTGLTTSGDAVILDWSGTPTTIEPDDSAAGGSSSYAARIDHAHAIVAAAPSANLSVSSANAEGASTSFARADHSHAITASDSPGAASALLKSDASGELTLQALDIGADCRIYRDSANVLRTPDSFQIDGQLDLATAGSSAGIEIYSDFKIYRSLDAGIYAAFIDNPERVYVQANAVSGQDTFVHVQATATGTNADATVKLHVNANAGATTGYFEIWANYDDTVTSYLTGDLQVQSKESSNGDVRVAGGLWVGSVVSDPDSNDIHYDGNLKSYKNTTSYDVYAFHPYTVPKTSTSWDGDSKTTGDNGIIDLPSVFGTPEGAKAVLVRMSIVDETAHVYAAIGPSSSYPYAMFCRTQVANQYDDQTGIVPCDSNGDFYWSCGGELDEVHIQIYGYWI